jgi:hypothetical protein
MDLDAADEVFADLPLLERSLLWSMRCWVIGARASIDVRPRIARLFRQLHAEAGFGYLDGLLWALSDAKTRMPAVYCVCDTAVGADETLLLDSLALCQAGRSAAAEILLARLVAPPVAGIARVSAARLVGVLNQAGHHLPRAEAALRRHAFAAPLGAACRMVSTTVH